MTRPHLSAVRHPQRPHLRGGPRDGGQTTATTSSSSACTAWANPCMRSSRLAARDALPHLCAGGPHIATCWPIWCAGACWRTAPTRASSTRSSTRTSRRGRRRRPVRAGAGQPPSKTPAHPPPRDLFAAGARRTPRASTWTEPASWNSSRRATASPAHWRAGPVWPDRVRGGAAERCVRPADRRPSAGARGHRGQSPRRLDAAQGGARQWSATPVAERAAVLRRAADLYEEHFGEIFAIAAREAGKTLLDAWRAARGGRLPALLRRMRPSVWARSPQGARRLRLHQPWNFPLAIFTGQIAAALAAGNGVLAKPAEQTPIIATIAGGLLPRGRRARQRSQLAAGATARRSAGP
jgi:hypothetical protein